MVIIVCVNIIVIRVIGVKNKIMKRWVCLTGTQILLFGYHVGLAVMVIMDNMIKTVIFDFEKV